MWLACCLGAVVALSAVGLRFLDYSNDLGLMLPSDPGVQRTMRFLRESNLSREVIVSLALTDDNRTTRDLVAATDRFIGSIRTPLVTDVSGTLSGGDAMAGMTAFLRYTPQILSAESFSVLTNRLTPDGVRGRLKTIYLQCLAPMSFAMPFMRADPLGSSDGLLRDVSRMFDSLAAASTLIGAGALLFARHPTLLSVGATLVTGVLAGYITSLRVIPPIYRLWIAPSEHRKTHAILPSEEKGGPV